MLQQLHTNLYFVSVLQQIRPIKGGKYSGELSWLFATQLHQFFH